MIRSDPDPMSSQARRSRSVPGPAVGAALLLALGCGTPANFEDVPRAGLAVLRPAGGSEVRGVVRFEPHPQGVRVRADVSGLPAGEHAYHVHLYGDCSAADASSAGTHFNFVGSSTDPPEDIDRITGNLGELVSEGGGPAHHEAVVERASLVGPKSIVGRAVVVHARGNDPDSPPIGAAGSRIACGVIGAAAPSSDDADGSDGESA